MVVSMTEKYATKFGDFVREWNNLEKKYGCPLKNAGNGKNRGNSCETARSTAVYPHTVQARRDG